MGNLRFGDIYTKDLDLIIQAPPVYNFPAKDVSIEHIPGRNGDLIIDNKCWQNVERTYSIASVFRPGTNFINNAEKLIKWLTSIKGYQRLEDTYDPLVYRMATFKNNGSLQNYYDTATILNITFDCKPQRYLKEGDIPISFNGSLALLKNPTGKPSLPIITINNLNISSDDKVILLTVENLNLGDATSIVSLSKYPFDNITIDSDLQTATYIDNNYVKDANKYIGLNGKEFPVLEAGESKIKIKSYDEVERLIPKYNTIIDSEVLGQNYNTCLALYKPKDAIIESKQQSVYIKSYSLLKQQLQEVYDAEAYASYCMKKSKEYTFISFNTVLANTCQSYSFQTEYSSKPDWLTISDNLSDNTKVDVRVGSLSSFSPYNTGVAYFISNNDKKIRRLNTGDLIGTFSKSNTVTVTVYPAYSNGSLGVNYNDYAQPSWLYFDITYDSEGSPIKITYYSNSSGYYYLPKSGLFGKAKWETRSSRAELTSLEWSSYKKAFMPSGISTSTTVSFEYHYLDSLPQYEPVMIDVLDENGNVKKDANGNPIQTISNAVHFIIQSNSDLSSVTYKAKEAGYFRMNDSDQSTGWRYYAANATIAGANNAATASNIVYYLEDIPDYPAEDIPEWLDNHPTLVGQQGSAINPVSVDFTVKQDGWYRYTYTDSNDNTLYTEWAFRSANSTLGIISPDVEARGPNTNTTIYRLEGTSSEFPVKEYSYTDQASGNTVNDIGFFYLDNQGQQIEYPNNIPPSWLTVNVSIDGDTTFLNFVASHNGLYKWDNNSVWITKNSESNIVTSTSKDDTSIYYLEELPDYPSYTEVNVIINQNVATGNPESITVTAKVPGYFRAKNASNWTYYVVGDELCTSKISESTTIYYLQDDGSQLELAISVTPRWWML